MVIFQLNCLFTGGYVDWHPKIHIVHPKICDMWIYDDLCGFSVYHFPHHLLKWHRSSGDGVWRFLGSFGVFAESRVFLRSGCPEIISMWWKKKRNSVRIFLVGSFGGWSLYRDGGWTNPGFMIFHEVSSMIKGDDPGKTPALDDESWVVYRVGLPIWMRFFFAHDSWIQKTGQVHFWNLQKR